MDVVVRACVLSHDYFGFSNRLGQLRLGDKPGEPDRVGVLEVGINGGHDDAGFHRDQIDADQ